MTVASPLTKEASYSMKLQSKIFSPSRTEQKQQVNKAKRSYVSLIAAKALSISDKYWYLLIFVPLVIAGINLFYHLGNNLIQDWDEARQGVNAFEMLRNNNFIVNTYNGTPDYWNLKPPLSFWEVDLGYKVFGFNTLGLRFFSALSMLFTIVIVGIFTKVRYGSIAALVSISILGTTYQLMLTNAGRTGDPNALFILLLTISLLSMLLVKRSTTYLFLCGFFFALAFLTKSWEALIILAILGCYLTFTRTIFRLRVRDWLLMVAAIILPILVWGIFRYSYDGFIFFREMIRIDLLKRSTSVIEKHVGSPFYYWELLYAHYFGWLLVFISCFIGYLALKGRKSSEGDVHHDLMGLFLWILIPSIAFSISKTKLPWYNLAIYPALAICSGYFMSVLIKNGSSVLKYVLVAMFVVFALSSEKGIYTAIKTTDISPIQNAFQQFGRRSEYHLAHIYSSDGIWRQGTFLAAELYADLTPENGGYTYFSSDTNTNALFMLPNNEKDVHLVQNDKVVFKNNYYLIVVKSE
jgi:4-amino-4-deoxy-L-arabinose transferase-like glycosyltransferase